MTSILHIKHKSYFEFQIKKQNSNRFNALSPTKKVSEIFKKVFSSQTNTVQKHLFKLKFNDYTSKKEEEANEIPIKQYLSITDEDIEYFAKYYR